MADLLSKLPRLLLITITTVVLLLVSLTQEYLVNTFHSHTWEMW